MYRTPSIEIRAYRAIGIRRWKRWLPDGGRLAGSTFDKRTLGARDPSRLRQFVIETRRAEFAHWLMIFALPIFLHYNPIAAWGIVVPYALLSNLPCIATQRYNRNALSRLAGRVAQREMKLNFVAEDAEARACAV
jgi:glycosyl-4,4'-diaponeurosporenoate acyltransferase